MRILTIWILLLEPSLASPLTVSLATREQCCNYIHSKIVNKNQKTKHSILIDYKISQSVNFCIHS